MGINSKINRSPIEDIIVLIETILNVARIFDQKETRYHKIYAFLLHLTIFSIQLSSRRNNETRRGIIMKYSTRFFEAHPSSNTEKLGCRDRFRNVQAEVVGSHG